MRAAHPLALAALLLACGCATGREEAVAAGRAQDRARLLDDSATVTHRFADAEKWARRFEDPARDEWQRPNEVLGWLDLALDAWVADIGAATGYFSVRFARAAPEGRVYGVDVEPTLVNYLNLRALREGLPNLVGLVCTPDDPRLPEPVDLVFVCDTYHHIDGRVAYFEAVRQRLRPGGRLAIIDYAPGDLAVGPPAGHKIAPEAVIEELARAGYALVRRESLPYQYFLLFQPAPE